MRENATYRRKDGFEYKCFVFVLEYVAGRTLFDFMVIVKNLDCCMARTYFIILLKTLEHLHSKGIAHRDIKPENIMVNS